MSDLLLMAGASGLPRQGLCALYDPYRDAYGLDATARAALQTGVDYSGRGNTLTYGATTGASTDDPTNTGTAWSFDGGDYLLTPDFGNGDLTAYTVFKMAGTLSGATPAIWGRNNAQLFWNTASSKCVFAMRDSTSTSRVLEVTSLSLNTWYLAGCRMSASGDWSLGVTTLGALSASGYTPSTTYSTWGDYVGRASTAYMEGSVALHVLYNRVVTDSEGARIRQYIKGLMAQRGITLP